MDVVAALVADRKTPEPIEPCDGPFDHPAIAAKLLAAFDAASGDARFDAAPPAGAATEREIVSLVGVQFVRPAARPSAPALDRWDRVEQRLQHLAVMAIGRAQQTGERGALAIDHDVALGPRLAAIGRVGADLRAPLFAGTAALSTAARLQSMRSASLSRFNSSWWRRSHTPARCQSRKRRQQVMPQPQPISCGSISQGMPLFSTNRMPVSAARSETGGRPPFGFGRGGGNSGATTAHSSAETRGFAMVSNPISSTPW
jgi:hypothetical protein